MHKKSKNFYTFSDFYIKTGLFNIYRATQYTEEDHGKNLAMHDGACLFKRSEVTYATKIVLAHS